MSKTYYQVSAELYYRDGKYVGLGIDPYEFSQSWWRAQRGSFDGQIFYGELSNYSNPNDILPNTNIIQAANRKMIELMRNFTDEIEVFETKWLNAPAEFISRNYQVFRILPLSGYIDIEKSGFIEDIIPGNPVKIIKTVTSPVFVNSSPDLLRPLEGAGVFASDIFRKECNEKGIRGLNFSPV